MAHRTPAHQGANPIPRADVRTVAPIVPAHTEQLHAARRKAIARLGWGFGVLQEIQGDIWFRKHVRDGDGELLLVTVRSPGFLRVANARTGDVLAESMPGQPTTLSEDFEFQPSSSKVQA
jgi:hypothetical protein